MNILEGNENEQVSVFRLLIIWIVSYVTVVDTAPIL